MDNPTPFTIATFGFRFAVAVRFVVRSSGYPVLENIFTKTMASGMLSNLFAREDGQGVVEYALILVLIVVVVIGIGSILGTPISTVLS